MKSRANGSVTAIAVATVGALVLIGSSSCAREVAYPVEHAAQVVRTGVWSRICGVFRGSAAEAENVRLRREVAALSVLRGDIDRLEVENARLRRVLDYSARTPEVWLAAGVLSSGGGAASIRDVIRVDKGSLSGVRPGAVVVVPEGLVGRVTAVSPHVAEVTLVTDPSVKVACEIETVDGRGLSGILSGGTAEQLLVRHLMGTGKARPQACVRTSGHGGVFPPGLEIGILLGVTNGVRGVEGTVLPRPDFLTLKDVFIRRAK